MIIIVMGVSGVGKSTVGRKLADSLGFQFADADDYHSDENRAKMSAGESLTDLDRKPWLLALSATIDEWRRKGENAVLACSALKKAYRDNLLAAAGDDYLLAYLKADYNKIHARMEARQNHFMKANMLRSQFAALEEPDMSERYVAVDADLPLETIITQLTKTLAEIA